MRSKSKGDELEKTEGHGGGKVVTAVTFSRYCIYGGGKSIQTLYLSKNQ